METLNVGGSGGEAFLLNSSAAIGAPIDPVVIGRVVWLRDALGDPGIHQLDLDTGGLIRSLGRRGEGPGEFGQVPAGISPVPGSSDAAWIWDPGNQRLVKYETGEDGELQFSNVWLRGAPPVTHMLLLNDSTWLGQSSRFGERFWFFGIDGAVRDSSPGIYYGPTDIDVDNRVRATIAGTSLCAWPNRGFAVVNFSIGRIDFFSASGEFNRSAEVPRPTEPNFLELEDGRKVFAPSSAHYMVCRVRDDKLFALYAGGTEYSVSESANSASHGQEIHVFDWSGKQLGAAEAPVPVRSFTFTEPEGEVVATSLETAHVYRFPIDWR